jgi:hypothetical protein
MVLNKETIAVQTTGRAIDLTMVQDLIMDRAIVRTMVQDLIMDQDRTMDQDLIMDQRIHLQIN